MFIDYLKIKIQSGKGGAGSVHFRREKYLPKGGPDGGNGGDGGSIIMKGNEHLHTLLHLKYKKIIKAKDGGPGHGMNKYGSRGADEYIEVPLGTQIYDDESSKIIGEIIEHNQELVVAQGGKGGLGNTYFKSPTNQTPRYAQPGIPGEEKRLTLELKILADVGLVGKPNAGKSTLLSKLSAAKPKIGDYPFTTLVPNVGVVRYKDTENFVMADIPGIIPGASQGKGLGLKFLRHIERNASLVILIEASDDIKDTYEILLNELNNYSKQIAFKKKLLAISKVDLLDQELIEEIKQNHLPDIKTVFISSFTGHGLNELKDAIWQNISIT